MTVRNRREKKKGKKGGRPESSEKLERGTKLESEPGGEVGLGEQRQASTVDLVVPEHLQHDGDVDDDDDGDVGEQLSQTTSIVT